MGSDHFVPEMTQPPLRVVLDTNVLVGAAYAPDSASGRIVQACFAGRLVAVASPGAVGEYQRILAQAVRSEGARDRLQTLIGKMELVEPAQVPRHVPGDPQDDKFLAVAVAGRAAWIVTSDQHLLGLDPYWEIRIACPADFAAVAGI
jgi:putative PIN family toxin of toxin-antitoxin system